MSLQARPNPAGVRFPSSKDTKALKQKPKCLKIGGAEGNRTPDLLNAIEALSQLSYNPISDGMRAYYNKNF